jgi:hypothetical protein
MYSALLSHKAVQPTTQFDVVAHEIACIIAEYE